MDKGKFMVDAYGKTYWKNVGSSAPPPKESGKKEKGGKAPK